MSSMPLCCSCSIRPVAIAVVALVAVLMLAVGPPSSSTQSTAFITSPVSTQLRPPLPHALHPPQPLRAVAVLRMQHLSAVPPAAAVSQGKHTPAVPRTPLSGSVLTWGPCGVLLALLLGLLWPRTWRLLSTGGEGDGAMDGECQAAAQEPPQVDVLEVWPGRQTLVFVLTGAGGISIADILKWTNLEALLYAFLSIVRMPCAKMHAL